MHIRADHNYQQSDSRWFSDTLLKFSRGYYGIYIKPIKSSSLSFLYYAIILCRILSPLGKGFPCLFFLQTLNYKNYHYKAIDALYFYFYNSLLSSFTQQHYELQNIYNLFIEIRWHVNNSADNRTSRGSS